MAAPIVGENSIGIRLAWRSFHTVIRWSASFEDLPISRTPGGSLLPRGLPASVLHFAPVESHCRIVANWIAVVNPRRKRGFSEEIVNERCKMRQPRR
jgi:hypothetical protein